MSPDLDRLPNEWQALLGADRACFWRRLPDGSAMPHACLPQGWLTHPFVAPATGEDVHVVQGPASRRQLPMAVRRDLPADLDRAAVLHCRGDAQSGFFAFWADAARMPRDLTRLGASIASHWALVVRGESKLEQVTAASVQLDSLVKALPQGVALVGPPGRPGLVNAPVATRLGLASGAVDSVALADALYRWLRTAQNFAAVQAEADGLLREGRTGTIRLEFSAPFAVVQVTVAPIGPGAAEGWVWLLQDVTADHLAATELHNAKQAADEANAAKSLFLATMSHEIRTPMNAIIGMSRLVLKTPLQPFQRDFIHKVWRAGQNLLGIINDILDFSKIEAGRLELESLAFDLADVIEQVTTVVGVKASEKGLSLRFDLDPELPRGWVGDPLRLAQVLLNLGNNAAKFTASGEILVGARVQEQLPGAALVHFWVRDSGIGMTPDQLERLFQPFTQGDSSTTRRFGGTGLGLAISRDLVERMGGRIWADSEPGRGSTFHFTVRLGRTPGAEPGDTTAQGLTRGRVHREQDTEAAIAQLAGARVLLVEDNDMNTELAVALLGQAGVQVVTASNGQEALDRLAEDGDFDGVLMDCQMPVMDGYEATRRIRAHPAWAQLPVVALTASAMVGDRDRVMEAGMVDHIGKPFQEDEFFGTMARWFGPRAQAAGRVPSTRAPLGDPPAAQPSEAPSIAPIAGVDLAAGLARTMNQPGLLFRMLKRLEDSQSDFILRFDEAIRQGDRAGAQRLAHTLKANAGHVGAVTLQSLAGRLEQACQAGGPGEPIEQARADLAPELATVLTGIRAATPSPQPPEASSPPAGGDPLRMVQQLRSLLEDGSADAVTLWDGHVGFFARAFPASWPAIDKALREFDFDAALELAILPPHENP